MKPTGLCVVVPLESVPHAPAELSGVSRASSESQHSIYRKGRMRGWGENEYIITLRMIYIKKKQLAHQDKTNYFNY